MYNTKFKNYRPRLSQRLFSHCWQSGILDELLQWNPFKDHSPVPSAYSANHRSQNCPKVLRTQGARADYREGDFFQLYKKFTVVFKFR